MAARMLTVGEAARRSGLTPKAVRFYEARGLLAPVSRTHAGYRSFTEHDVRLLRFIRQARDLGLTVAGIRTIIGLRRGEAPPSAEVIALLESQLRAIDAKISDLRALREAMTSVLDIATADAGRGMSVRLCRIIDDG